MARTLEELEAIVRERICRVYTGRKVDGTCGLEDPSSCALFRLFPQVARAVQSVNSDDINDYIRAIREHVCSTCPRDVDGECESRRQVQCALDAYVLPVIDAIEESTGRSFDRAEEARTQTLGTRPWAPFGTMRARDGPPADNPRPRVNAPLGRNLAASRTDAGRDSET
jgi:hypothetical protein